MPVPAAEETLTEIPREGSVFDEAALEDGVRDVLTRLYGLSGVSEVQCPSDQEVKVGHQFDCTVVINGDEHLITITVRTDVGEYEVSPPK